MEGTGQQVAASAAHAQPHSGVAVICGDSQDERPMGNGEVPQKRGRASIQWSDWLKFTQEFVTVSGVVEFLVQFKAGFPVLIEALPELVDMLAASEEIPK